MMRIFHTCKFHFSINLNFLLYVFWNLHAYFINVTFQTLGEKGHFPTNQFSITCWAQLVIDYIIIFMSTNSTWLVSDLNLVDFSTRLVSLQRWSSLPIDHWFLFLINSQSSHNGDIHFPKISSSIMLTASLFWLALFMDGWMLENLMDEIMFVFSTIVQLWFHFRFNLIVIFYNFVVTSFQLW
jgi:hypothetical protein